MRSRLVCFATIVAIVFSAAAVFAADYSFEVIVPGGGPPGPDGFFGLGATVSQDVIGATDLLHSMKYDVGVGGFVGARTEIVPPTLNNPPGVTDVMFDITIPQTYADTFANMGVTVFGHALNPGGPGTFGNQVQFLNEYALAGKQGTLLNQLLTLGPSVGPYRPGETFNQIFGPVDPNDLTVASAFQFYINKTVLTPITIYIDNVRFVPEPATFALVCMGAVVGAFGWRRRG